MIHRNRLQSVIEIRAGERSRTIAPGARVDLAEELWPGYPLARAVDPGWFEPELREYLVPNAVAEAAKDFGVTDDRVRLAIARAAMIDGRKVGQWSEAVSVAAPAAAPTQDDGDAATTAGE